MKALHMRTGGCARVTLRGSQNSCAWPQGAAQGSRGGSCWHTIGNPPQPVAVPGSMTLQPDAPHRLDADVWAVREELLEGLRDLLLLEVDGLGARDVLFHKVQAVLLAVNHHHARRAARLGAVRRQHAHCGRGGKGLIGGGGGCAKSQCTTNMPTSEGRGGEGRDAGGWMAPGNRTACTRNAKMGGQAGANAR